MNSSCGSNCSNRSNGGGSTLNNNSVSFPVPSLL